MPHRGSSVSSLFKWGQLKGQRGSHIPSYPRNNNRGKGTISDKGEATEEFTFLDLSWLSGCLPDNHLSSSLKCRFYDSSDLFEQHCIHLFTDNGLVTLQWDYNRSCNIQSVCVCVCVCLNVCDFCHNPTRWHHH